VLVEAHVDDSRGTVVTNIVNFGSQIPEDVRHKIFQRFVMGITTRGSESGGTGLGLSIAKWAATLHGGSIHVVDDSRGVDFEIVLPLHPDVEGTGPRKQ
jgi:signal transduction histidine kinase